MTAVVAGIGRAEVEDFLYDEADLLDGWRLEEWLALCTDDVVYEVPSTTHPNAPATASLYIIHDDRYMLEARIRRLLSRNAHAENPQSRTRRLVANVRVRPAERPDELQVQANFHVLRFRNDEVHQYVGRYLYRLRLGDGGGLRIAHRRATLDADSLRHGGGKVSILL